MDGNVQKNRGHHAPFGLTICSLRDPEIHRDSEKRKKME